MKKILFGFLLFPLSIFAQIGGASTFEFVTLPYSATENALGGNQIALVTTEKNLATTLKNPSLLNTSYSNEAVGSWGLLHLKESGIGCGTIGYAHSIRENITLDGGIHFINYGKFEGYDEYGNSTENFFPSEYQLIFGGSWNQPFYNEQDSIQKFWANFSFGVNIKPIMSYMESYSSYGLLFDIGASYITETGHTCLTLVARNIGFQLKPYTEGNREPVPYSIDFGYSQQLEHAPIRFNITYEDLQKFDLSYETKSATKTTNSLYVEEEEREFVTFGKNFLKHVNLSAELLLGKNIVIMGGYNYRKSEDLSFGSTKHGAGFSAGFALNFSRFSISYGWAKQQAAGGRNYFTLELNTQTIYSVCKNTLQKHKTSTL